MTYRGRHYWGSNPLIDNYRDFEHCYPYRGTYCNWRTPYYGGYYRGYGRYYGGYGRYYGGYGGYYGDW